MSDTDIDLPGLKEILWHKMRADLGVYFPSVLETDRLMCPACCRLLPFQHFNIEHIIPSQSLSDDPQEVRKNITKAERGAFTLLCTKSLIIKGKKLYDNGCNSWKGRFFDRFIRETFNGHAVTSGHYTSRHQVALFVLGYLGLFERYGYQITLAESGVTMRRQFFNANDFNRDVPHRCQMILTGAPVTSYSPEDERYWKPPIKVTVQGNSFYVGVRNISLILPMSRDPELPIAHRVRFVPQKYLLRPDFRTVFH